MDLATSSLLESVCVFRTKILNLYKTIQTKQKKKMPNLNASSLMIGIHIILRFIHNDLYTIRENKIQYVAQLSLEPFRTMQT